MLRPSSFPTPVGNELPSSVSLSRLDEARKREVGRGGGSSRKPEREEAKSRLTKTQYETTQEPSQQAIALKVAIRRSAARREGGEQRI